MDDAVADKQSSVFIVISKTRSAPILEQLMKSLKIDPEMVEKVWVFSSETDVVPSSCLLSCALLSCVILMLSWQWRAIKLMSLARDKIFKHVMFDSLGAVLELSTPKIGLR